MSQILEKGFRQLSSAARLINEGRCKSVIFTCRSGTHRSVGGAALVAEWLTRGGGHGGWQVVEHTLGRDAWKDRSSKLHTSPFCFGMHAVCKLYIEAYPSTALCSIRDRTEPAKGSASSATGFLARQIVLFSALPRL